MRKLLLAAAILATAGLVRAAEPTAARQPAGAEAKPAAAGAKAQKPGKAGKAPRKDGAKPAAKPAAKDGGAAKPEPEKPCEPVKPCPIDG